MYRSSLGSAVIAPLRLGPPSLFQLNRVIGSRSLLSNRRCWRGSQAMPSKPLFFLPILPSGNSARLLVLRLGGLRVDMEDGQGIAALVGHRDVAVLQHRHAFGIAQAEQRDGAQHVAGERQLPPAAAACR